MKYSNFETLKKNSDFKKVYNKKISYANKYLVMYILENGTDTLRLGVSVSKKVGNSIVRHRLARLIREAFRLNNDNVKRGLDIVVVARAGLKEKGYKETERAMLHLMKHLDIITDPKEENND
ncbi:ribonuclease P protein component [Eubacterium sp. CAG:86]|nr:ribonuclease P protein component [Eubacterium sp. CAG:86]